MSGDDFLTRRVVPLPEGGGTLPEHHLPWCFGCGPENDTGLGIRPRLEGDLVVAEVRFHERFHGGPGLVHGGAIAAFLDDLLGFVPMVHDLVAVTARLDVRFLSPVPIEETVTGRAWLGDIDGRKVLVEGIAAGADGLHAEARAVFVIVDPDHFTRELDRLTPQQRAYLEAQGRG